jgi:hypothetical protein
MASSNSTRKAAETSCAHSVTPVAFRFTIHSGRQRFIPLSWSVLREVAMTWKPSDIIAVVAAGIAFASLVLTLLNRRAVRHAGTIQALQGEKQAVAYVAFQVSKGQIPRAKGRREEVLQSLCLAAVYENSGRSRVMIYSALRQAKGAYSQEVHDAVRSIDKRFEEFRGITNLSTAYERLAELKSALDFPETPS